MAVDVPRTLGRYQLLGEVGTSHLGSLWVARATGADPGQPAAMVRRIPIDGENQESTDLVSEAAWASMELQHPRVPTVLDVVVDHGEIGIVSEYVEGLSLKVLTRNASRRRQAVPPAISCQIIRGLLQILADLHACSDGPPPYGAVSPDGIWIGADGHTYLLDPLVTAAMPSSPSVNVHPERLSYTCPEQGEGQPADALGDVFSAGVVLWEVLSTRRLFSGNKAAVQHQLRSTRIPHLSDLPSRNLPVGVADVVARSLERERTRRFQSALEMLAALDECKTARAECQAVRRCVEDLGGTDLRRQREWVRGRTAAPKPGGGPLIVGPSSPGLRVTPGGTRAGPNLPSTAGQVSPHDRKVRVPQPTLVEVPLTKPTVRRRTLVGIPGPAELLRKSLDPVDRVARIVTPAVRPPEATAGEQAPGRPRRGTIPGIPAVTLSRPAPLSQDSPAPRPPPVPRRARRQDGGVEERRTLAWMEAPRFAVQAAGGQKQSCAPPSHSTSAVGLPEPEKPREAPESGDRDTVVDALALGSPPDHFTSGPALDADLEEEDTEVDSDITEIRPMPTEPDLRESIAPRWRLGADLLVAHGPGRLAAPVPRPYAPSTGGEAPGNGVEARSPAGATGGSTAESEAPIPESIPTFAGSPRAELCPLLSSSNSDSPPEAPQGGRALPLLHDPRFALPPGTPGRMRRRYLLLALGAAAALTLLGITLAQGRTAPDQGAPAAPGFSGSD